MQHSIYNKYLQVSVLSKGVEISSIKSLKTGREYMWNANPDIWGSHSPVLFPAIGSFKKMNVRLIEKDMKFLSMDLSGTTII